MFTDTKERKRCGQWGESMVDKYMKGVGYDVALENKVIRGGEIDRLYLRYFKPSGACFICVSEVKTSSVHSVSGLVRYAEFSNLAKFVKPRQMRNLKRFGEGFAATMMQSKDKISLHARLFLVVRIIAKDGLQLENVEDFPGKVCVRSAGYWVLSLDPEVTAPRFMH